MESKEALLFYKDGRVCFTRRMIEGDLRRYREAVAHPFVDVLPDWACAHNTSFGIRYTDFRRVTDVLGYAVFEEI